MAKPSQLSIATLLHHQALVPITVNNHQSGFMQAQDGRQMYLRHSSRRFFRRGKYQIIVG